MKKNFLTAVWFTLVTTLICGVVYPLVVTGLSQLLFPGKANGQLVDRNGKVIGSRIIGQNFSGPGYFHSRPSAAGSGYDPTSSGSNNLGPTNKALIDRVKSDVEKAQRENPSVPVPIDLVTVSGSGLDPDISPAAAEFQIPRVAQERHMNPNELRQLVHKHTEGRQLGFLGEPRINVLELNLELDVAHPLP
jgi:potassium-transporting ATPase KdpC subunit